MTVLIPKKIHYCWFGGNPIPEKFQKNIVTWKKYFPDFEFICWDENKFDITSHRFVKKAYEMKKWAFVSDYARLWALYHEGGIYLDTDVEVTQSFSPFLDKSFFVGMDFHPYSEFPNVVGTGVIGSIAGHSFLKSLLDYYGEDEVVEKMTLTPNNGIFTELATELGLQKNNQEQIIGDGMHIYPSDYFCAFNYKNKRQLKTKNTYAIHRFEGSWVAVHDQSLWWHMRKKMKALIRSLVGERVYWFMKDAFNQK